MSQVTSGVLGATQGGTGQSSYSIGDILYADTTTSLARLADVAVGNALISGGLNVAPAWGKIALASAVSGTLPVANGGTGQTTANAAFNALAPSQATNSGKYLTTNGTDTSWATVTQTTFSAGTTGFTPATATSGTVTLAGTLNIANGGTGATTRQDAMDALAGATTSGQYLRGNGTDVVMSAIVAGDVPTLNQNTTGSAGSVANSVTFNNGGAGAISGTTYNGSAAQTISYNTVGAYAATNPSGFTSNTGTVTSISGGSYLTGGTITTSGTLAVDATTTNTASKVVARDASGNFSAGTITAALTGNVTGNVSGSSGSCTGNAATATTATTATTCNGNYNTTNAQQNGSDGWWRSTGSAGWYSTTYAVGIYSVGAGLVQTYNSSSFQANGALYATGNVTAYYSDERLKTNLGNVKNALDSVCKLNGFRYVNNDLAKSVGYESEEVQLGVSAQEVEALFPEIVTLAPFDMNHDEKTGEISSKSGEEYKTVDYARLVPVLIEAIKELKAEVDELKKAK
jgi:hypothetical protein